jgi:hypothetical protein
MECERNFNIHVISIFFTRASPELNQNICEPCHTDELTRRILVARRVRENSCSVCPAGLLRNVHNLPDSEILHR